ncbi:hypothetical protein GMDG_08143 [Pseudogymnoascus destructans 20631-21]|uniref:Uncharacterized protein n=1 Tax=Pseudogymnoascus destructans (strain ATCC MYA-4855 / 20631-21) TaxID=658429 RepID=L8G141_PSED2|nr:hypothetical protein GMDG_08143 [Pseudogymnoascus destructans 20631-21]
MLCCGVELGNALGGHKGHPICLRGSSHDIGRDDRDGRFGGKRAQYSSSRNQDSYPPMVSYNQPTEHHKEMHRDAGRVLASAVLTLRRQGRPDAGMRLDSLSFGLKATQTEDVESD